MKPSYISIIPTSAFHSMPLAPMPPGSPKKTPKVWHGLCSNTVRTRWWVVLLSVFVCVSVFNLAFTWRSMEPIDGSCNHGGPSRRQDIQSAVFEEILQPVISWESNFTESERLFWRQPDSLGYEPCIEFSPEYKETLPEQTRQRRRYLMVVVNGGLNQQRNQIVDAVVIARILGAALVVPILQVNRIWEDDSEFSDIFDLEHFKETLADDVTVVSNLPSTHLMTKPLEEISAPMNSPPAWFRSQYLSKFTKGVLLLRSLDSRLSKDLPLDLQRLRCKAAFHALRYAALIRAVGNKIARRMVSKGPYLALHLRLEKDVWVRTGCSPGLGPSYDAEVEEERILKPQFLTSRNHLNQTERRMAGLCPLTAEEITRLLSSLGATKRTNIFWAGGEPLGGAGALQPLVDRFPNLYNKEDLALPGELEVFGNKASMLAAIDSIVCLNSNVFMPSHGGNMGRAVRGSRIYAGHRKTIIPNKRLLIPLLTNTSLSQEEMEQKIAELHFDPVNQLVFRTDKIGLDVLAFPMPECMCQRPFNKISY